MTISDSISIDHSTSSQSFHSTELLRCLVELIWFSRDGETMLETNNSGLMKFPRLSETTTGRTTALISKTMAAVTTSELLLASTQDGGNYSDTKTVWLLTREERLWQSMVDLITKTETSSWSNKTERLTRDGESFMLKTTRRSQLRVNLTRSSAFTWKETSTSLLLYQATDTST